MLELTRLTGQSFALNPDLIERAEATPDTVVTLVNGSKYVLGETLDELIALVREWRVEIVLATRTSGDRPTRPGVHARDQRLSHEDAAGATVVMLHSEHGDA